MIFTPPPPPVNQPPVAYIDTIAPNPATVGTTVNFAGHGVDTDGTVVGCSWKSGILELSQSMNFTTSTLSVGTHSINFSVADNLGSWSAEVSRQVVIFTPPPPVILTRIELSLGTTTLFVGSTTTATVVAFYSNNSTNTVTGIASIASSAPSIASIVGNIITGVASGTVSVAATFQGKSDSKNIVVIPPPLYLTPIVLVKPENGSVCTDWRNLVILSWYGGGLRGMDWREIEAEFLANTIVGTVTIFLSTFTPPQDIIELQIGVPWLQIFTGGGSWFINSFQPNTTYYWRIKCETTVRGIYLVELGDIWTFTTGP